MLIENFIILNISRSIMELNNKIYACCIIVVLFIFNLVFYFKVNINSKENYTEEVKTDNQTRNQINLIENINFDQNSAKLPVNPSVFCIIKTHPNNIAINKTLTVLKVWGQKCNNYR